MERYCGYVKRHLHSRRYPWTEIDNFVKHDAQLRNIKVMFGNSEELQFSSHTAKKADESKFPGCEHHLLCLSFVHTLILLLYEDHKMIVMPPHIEEFPLTDNALRNQVGKHFSTRFSVDATETTPAIKISRAVVLRHLPKTISRWGKVRFTEGGDTIKACEVVKQVVDSRDATYCRVSDSIDLVTIVAVSYLLMSPNSTFSLWTVCPIVPMHSLSIKMSSSTDVSSRYMRSRSLQPPNSFLRSRTHSY